MKKVWNKNDGLILIGFFWFVISLITSFFLNVNMALVFGMSVGFIGLGLVGYHPHGIFTIQKQGKTSQ